MSFQRLLGGSLFKNEVPEGSKKPFMGNGKITALEDIRKGEEISIGLWKGVDQQTGQPYLSFAVTRQIADQQQPPQQQYQAAPPANPPQQYQQQQYQQQAPPQAAPPQYQQQAPAPVAQPGFQSPPQQQQVAAPGQPPMAPTAEDSDVPF